MPRTAVLALMIACTAAAHAAGPGAKEPIQPIAPTTGLDARKVALGKKLFNDPLLSADGTISCASCHRLDAGGTDRLPRSIGVGGARGGVNAPTVFNASLNFRQFWDGRSATLEHQVDGPLQDPAEMGADWKDVVAKLQRNSAYREAFAQVYGDGVTPETVKNAIAEFERSLVTPNARFDQYLRGTEAAMSEPEKSGYRKFKTYGCVSCHQGVNVGGNMFQRMGVIGDYFADRGAVTPADFGRYNVTRDEADRFMFKVPSLRNVDKTAPYFHDGSAATLPDAVAVMAKYQLGREIPQADIDEIVAFLKALTGEYEGKPL